MENVKIGISINDGYGVKFTDLILSGKKVIETRSKRTLDPFIGEWVGLIRTGIGKATLVGYILLGEPIHYTENGKKMEDDYDKHFVKSTDKKFYKNGNKYGYPIIDYKQIEPKILTTYKPINKYVRLDGVVCNVNRYVAREINENIDKIINECITNYISKNIIMNLNKIIKESINKVINESLSSKLFHFTTIHSLYNIMKNNEMKLTFSLNDTSDGNYHLCDYKPFFASFTRNKDYRTGFPKAIFDEDTSFARIEFNGNMLNNNFKGKPINYFYDKTNKKVLGGKSYYHNKPKIPYQQEETESEDRLFDTKPYIKNINKYITRIDIYITENSKNDLLICKELLNSNENIFIYNSLNDFNKQNNNTINNNISNSIKEKEIYNPQYTTITIDDAIYNVLKYIHLAILNPPINSQEKKEFILKNSIKILKEYNLEEYIKPLKNKFYNDIENNKINDTINNIHYFLDNIKQYDINIYNTFINIINNFFRRNKRLSI